MVNVSLTEGSFPSHFKSALVFPLLKKPTLHKDNMKIYQQVSSLQSINQTSIAPISCPRFLRKLWLAIQIHT